MKPTNLIHSQQQGRIQKYVILFTQIPIQLIIQLTVATVLKINIFFGFCVLCMSILFILNVKHNVHANLNLSSLIGVDPRRPNTSPKFYCRGLLFLQSILTNFCVSLMFLCQIVVAVTITRFIALRLGFHKNGGRLGFLLDKTSLSGVPK